MKLDWNRIKRAAVVGVLTASICAMGFESKDPERLKLRGQGVMQAGLIVLVLGAGGALTGQYQISEHPGVDTGDLVGGVTRWGGFIFAGVGGGLIAIGGVSQWSAEQQAAVAAENQALLGHAGLIAAGEEAVPHSPQFEILFNLERASQPELSPLEFAQQVIEINELARKQTSLHGAMQFSELEVEAAFGRPFKDADCPDCGIELGLFAAAMLSAAAP